jgi:Holliday junction resolvase
MNSRNKGKVGEREFAALLREHGFDARRGQQFSGSPDSPDVVSEALAWLHVEVKRVENLNLAEACAQAKRDAGGKPWIVAHRKNRGPWFITLESDALYEVLRQLLSHFDLWPFAGPRAVTLDAELFFQFLREIQRRRFTDEFGYVLPPDEATRINTPVLTPRREDAEGNTSSGLQPPSPQRGEEPAREDARPTSPQTISSPHGGSATGAGLE